MEIRLQTRTLPVPLQAYMTFNIPRSGSAHCEHVSTLSFCERREIGGLELIIWTDSEVYGLILISLEPLLRYNEFGSIR